LEAILIKLNKIDFKKKIINKIGLILFIMLLALSFLVVLELRKNQIKEVTKGMEETITKLALEINSYTQNTVKLSRSIAAYQKAGGFGRREEGVRYLRNILEDNPQLVGISLGYEPNADQQDSIYASKTGNVSKYHNSNGRYLVYWSRASENFELRKLVGMSNSQYYQEPKRTGEVTITEPYVYEGVMMTETAAPIFWEF
jgi:predicted amino acid-binding ACT domain protein